MNVSLLLDFMSGPTTASWSVLTPVLTLEVSKLSCFVVFLYPYLIPHLKIFCLLFTSYISYTNDCWADGYNDESESKSTYGCKNDFILTVWLFWCNIGISKHCYVVVVVVVVVTVVVTVAVTTVGNTTWHYTWTFGSWRKKRTIKKTWYFIRRCSNGNKWLVLCLNALNMRHVQRLGVQQNYCDSLDKFNITVIFLGLCYIWHLIEVTTYF